MCNQSATDPVLLSCVKCCHTTFDFLLKINANMRPYAAMVSCEVKKDNVLIVAAQQLRKHKTKWCRFLLPIWSPLTAVVSFSLRLQLQSFSLLTAVWRAFVLDRASYPVELSRICSRRSRRYGHRSTPPELSVREGGSELRAALRGHPPASARNTAAVTSAAAGRSAERAGGCRFKPLLGHCRLRSSKLHRATPRH